MNTRDQFGSYLLLKKVGEDALGETFRAGKIGRQGVERVLLLRVFNGQGLDSARLAQHLATVGPALQALKSPTLGLCVDSGQIGGVPFVAYDYISGKSLAALLEQARKKHSPVPFDHALLIAERAAMGLSVAYETRLGDERVLHGFLAPHLVMISNEGETRLLGFEAAGGLRGSAAHPLLREAFGRYLSPEVLAGQPRHKADDVYTLGALFFELLTGERIPAGSSAVLAAAVDAATLANEGTALPAGLAELLKQSFVPREQRIADAPTWHKSLSKQMGDGHYNPTTFNLAFYMHSLFRDEIDKESQEIEVEKTIQLSAEQLRPAAPAATPAAAPARSVEEEFGLTTPEKKGGMSPAVLGGIAAALVVAAVGGYMAFGRGSAPPPAATPAAPSVSGPSPEEIQKQIEQMLEEKLKAREAGLKTQYDDQIKAMKLRLEEAQKAAAADQARRGASGPATYSPTQVASATTVPTVAAPMATTVPAAAATSAPAPETPRPTPPPATSVAAAPSAAAPAASLASDVRPGDLVTMGPGVIPPRTIKLGAQRYPPAARRMSREATVTVRVLVGENGKVIDTQVPSRAGLGFDEAAQDTARETTFVPATKNGVPVRMWMELKIAFSLK